MIVRIVKMTFDPDRVNEFKDIFQASKEKIRNQPGCQHLELLQDIKHNNIFFTYSYWESEDDLNRYRNTDLFAQVWKDTKARFNDKPQAWSVNREWISPSSHV